MLAQQAACTGAQAAVSVATQQAACTGAQAAVGAETRVCRSSHICRIHVIYMYYKYQVLHSIYEVREANTRPERLIREPESPRPPQSGGIGERCRSHVTAHRTSLRCHGTSHGDRDNIATMSR